MFVFESVHVTNCENWNSFCESETLSVHRDIWLSCKGKVYNSVVLNVILCSCETWPVRRLSATRADISEPLIDYDGGVR